MKDMVNNSAGVLMNLLAFGNRNPSVDILGSYFPGWMISLAIAIPLTIALHSFLRKFGIQNAIGHPAVIYPGIMLFFTCLIWLLWFA